MKLLYKVSFLVGMFFMYGVAFSMDKLSALDEIDRCETKIEEGKKKLELLWDDKKRDWHPIDRIVARAYAERDGIDENTRRRDQLIANVMKSKL